jgi:hypothetical protein
MASNQPIHKPMIKVAERFNPFVTLQALMKNNLPDNAPVGMLLSSWPAD